MSARVARKRISAVMATYNGERFVSEQVSSMLAQTQPIDELVVGDDGSSDRTLSIVRELVDHAGDVDLVVLAPSGSRSTTANFQRAAAAATGDVLLFADQDDVWHPDHVEGLRAALAASPESVLAFSDAELIDAAGKHLGTTLFESLEITDKDIAALASQRAFHTLLRRNLVTGATMAATADFVRSAMPFPSEWVHDAWLAILASTNRRPLALASTPLLGYRQHGANQIGVAKPTLRGKIAVVTGSRGERNRGLSRQFDVLAQRIDVESAHPVEVDAATRKVRHEAARAKLPANRLARVPGVLTLAGRGGYARYSSRGRLDILRDLLQRSES